MLTPSDLFTFNPFAQVDEYEVLIGDMNRLRWVSANGKLSAGSLGYRPVEGGHEKDGTPVYVARVPYKGSTHPGKASEKLGGTLMSTFRLNDFVLNKLIQVPILLTAERKWLSK